MTSSPHAQVLLESALRDGGASLNELLPLYVNYLKLMATTQMDAKIRQRVSPSDVVQETCFEAHRDFHQFRGGTEREFVSWLRRILVHNIARLVERHVLADKRDVRREVSLEGMQRSLERSTIRLRAILADKGGSPSSQALRRERSVLLADQIAQLPEDYRDVIMLRNIEGLRFEEVAQRMNRSSGAARMLWLRAIDQLRTLLAERGLVS
ncbi:MAG: sigma-70 family RNA polymerase sigma factor [Planctomycetales bacterium]|nr:sigma-70 family RNA polymerase sigma factor [Planctomycetales bacterium]